LRVLFSQRSNFPRSIEVEETRLVLRFPSFPLNDDTCVGTFASRVSDDWHIPFEFAATSTSAQLKARLIRDGANPRRVPTVGSPQMQLFQTSEDPEKPQINFRDSFTAFRKFSAISASKVSRRVSSGGLKVVSLRASFRPGLAFAHQASSILHPRSCVPQVFPRSRFLFGDGRHAEHL
jgi:hypothetical protein